MSTFPGTPRVQRGALVSVDSTTLVPTVVAFQYNPFTLSRSYELVSSGGGSEAGQRPGPPIETIQVELELDATDDLAAGGTPDAVAARIAALELLVSPRSSDVIANLGLAAGGALEILPPDGPITLFVFGGKRVLPVELTELSVTEEGFDVELNPIRARVSVGMRVLRYADLPQSHPGHALSLANQVAREALAGTVQSGSLDNVVGGDITLL